MWRPIFFVLGVFTACVGFSMLLPLGVSLGYGDSSATGIALAMGLSIVLGLSVSAVCRDDGVLTLSHREALAAVGLCWIMASIVGGLPYVLNGQLTFTDAVFEAASGFTTTGATILSDIEAVPKGLLMWRSLTHWLGGMGIVVLSLAILPLLGVGGMQLYKAEVPGPTPDKLTPRMQDTAKMLWGVYVLLTLVEIVLLWAAGMDMFDAVNHSFSTMATGGFSTKNASIAAYPSPVIQWIIITFMFVAGINFALHYRFIKGDYGVYRHNTESLSYGGLLLGGATCIVIVLLARGVYEVSSLAEFEYVVRGAVFQLVSICTTTGFITENYILWPVTTQCILLFFMFMGGCAGSTGGGFKVIRIAILFRTAYQDLFQFLHPRSVRHIKIQGRPLPPEVLTGVLGFLLLYLGLIILGTLILSLFELNFATAFSATLTCLSNVGPGLGLVGPVDNFGPLPSAVKWVLSLWMLLGRLEIYAILVLVVPEFWRK